MNQMQIAQRRFEKEFVFRTSRSSGPGGQHVNKVNSKVELRFNISQSQILSNKEKHILHIKLKTKLTTGETS